MTHTWLFGVCENWDAFCFSGRACKPACGLASSLVSAVCCGVGGEGYSASEGLHRGLGGERAVWDALACRCHTEPRTNSALSEGSKPGATPPQLPWAGWAEVLPVGLEGRAEAWALQLSHYPQDKTMLGVNIPRAQPGL